MKKLQISMILLIATQNCLSRPTRIDTPRPPAFDESTGLLRAEFPVLVVGSIFPQGPHSRSSTDSLPDESTPYTITVQPDSPPHSPVHNPRSYSEEQCRSYQRVGCLFSCFATFSFVVGVIIKSALYP